MARGDSVNVISPKWKWLNPSSRKGCLCHRLRVIASLHLTNVQLLYNAIYSHQSTTRKSPASDGSNFSNSLFITEIVKRSALAEGERCARERRTHVECHTKRGALHFFPLKKQPQIQRKAISPTSVICVICHPWRCSLYPDFLTYIRIAHSCYCIPYSSYFIYS